MIGLDQRADIYTANASTGRLDHLDQAQVRCRLTHVGGGQSAPDRAALAALRVLLWQPDYVMPEGDVRVVVDGTAWQPAVGTYGALRGPNGRVVYRRAEVARAD